ncbi:RpiB/LacA/LacB family sugar-phosphate isomerase [Saccharopolyspora elongata]|uniref:RpiB/LacA/LacB family sugar-phosphate isomerase n=2 Tax=Saccharopolyspora elongata TaxID=2530387 RepID=A0A4R4Z8M7_9PSEU|nr:RpiB/LacA/LacB family sugar-phosphate isomerase [Saccharopolyspora elongata]
MSNSPLCCMLRYSSLRALVPRLKMSDILEDFMIVIAGDAHAGPALVRIREFLENAGSAFEEFGYRDGENPSAKLEEFIPQVARPVRDGEATSGVLVCGTGAGVEIGANRFPGVRASLCMTPRSAEWARVYDDANVLCLSSWALDEIDLEKILSSWYQASYDGDVARRAMFDAFDSWSVDA